MEFYLLTKKFYEKYSNCKEILKKENRPYTICIIEINKLTFAIPIRHNINHKYSIKTFNNQGLDFTKAVIIIDKAFILKSVWANNFIQKFAKKNIYINIETELDKIIMENKELSTKKSLIKPKLKKFIKTYKKAIKNPDDLKNKILCEFSSLQYFHKELSILFNENNID